MIASISNQVELFLYCLVFGFLIGICYDFAKSLRLKSVLYTFFLDCFFWILAISLIGYLLLNITIGEIRFFVIWGLILGNLFYFLTFSTLILKFFRFFSNRFYKLIFKFLRLFKKFIKNAKNTLFFNKNDVK